MVVSYFMGKKRKGNKKSKVVQLLEANLGAKSTSPSTGTSSAESSPEERRRKIPPSLVGGLTFPDRPRPGKQQRTLEVSSDEDTLQTQSTAMSLALPTGLPPVLQGLLSAQVPAADFGLGCLLPEVLGSSSRRTCPDPSFDPTAGI